MPRITQECAARIKDSADIVEIIGRYLTLRRSGNSWKACCPFHNEKTPSFHVNPARQSFHCFGCGVGGDALKFLMLFENIDYPTALRRVADMNGIPVIEEEENPEMARKRRLRSRVIEANMLAAEYFHRKLCRDQAAQHVRDYLRKREFNIDIAKTWKLGWAPTHFREFQELASSHHLDAGVLKEAYLLGQGQKGTYPVFRDRLMFPIHNVRGEVVGFSGRVMEQNQDPRKYVNTAETVAFHKGEQLFGLDKATSAIARAGMTVVICEGQLDVIACHEKADIRHAVAGLGTAFTENHARMLAKYAKKAILCYDGDNAGIKASEKTFRKLSAVGMDIYQATLPAGEDPDSLIKNQGAEALQEAIAQARPYLEVRLGVELKLSEGDSNARASLIPRMADLASEITDPNRRDIAIVDLATRLNTGLDNLRATVDEIIRTRRESPTPSPWNEGGEGDRMTEEEVGAEATTPVIPLRLHPTIRNLIRLGALHRGFQQQLVERVEELQEAIGSLAGGSILQKLLEVLPEPGSREAWEQFLHSLQPEQAAALQDIRPGLLELEDVPLAIEQAMERVARDVVQTEIDQLKARIFGGTLSREEMEKTMQRTLELQRLLNN